MQGYVPAVKVDGLVFATCLAAEDVSFLFLRIISALVIHLAHDSLKGLLLERLVKLLHALPICPRLHDSRRLASLLFGGVNGFGLGTSVLSSRYSGEGGCGYFLTFVCRTQVGIGFICVHITLCGELHRPFVHPFLVLPLFFGAHWIRLVYMGHPPRSSYQEVSSLAAPAPNFPLALLLISTRSHTWDVTAVDGLSSVPAHCCVLRVCVCVCWKTECVCSERSHTWAINRC